MAWPRRCGVAKAVGAGPRPWGVAMAVGEWPMPYGAWSWPWGCGQNRGSVAKPATAQSIRGGNAKAVGVLAAGRGQSLGGKAEAKAKAVGRGEGRGGLDKPVGAWPRPLGAR